MNQEQLCQLALCFIPKVGGSAIRSLISYRGSAEAVFASGPKDLIRIPGIGEKTIEAILNPDCMRAAENEARQIEDNGIRALFYTDADFPLRLKPFEDAPAMVFIRGEGGLNPSRTVGIIGTRTPTERGVAFVQQVVKELKPYGVTIISGLAYGIDVLSHRAALREGLPTWGIVGHGLGMLYPPDHIKTAAEMEAHGGVMTEFPFQTLIRPEHFPMRNRIIAAMSDALVVVESDRKGGSMITADFANQYRKDVFALPGRWADTLSRGCNMLIRDHRATLIEHGADIATAMRWDKGKKKSIAPQTSLFIELSENEKLVISQFPEGETVHFEKLLGLTGLTTSSLSPILLDLEFKGLLKNLPGMRYVRL